MITLIVIIGILLFLAWVFYQLQKSIGEEQTREHKVQFEENKLKYPSLYAEWKKAQDESQSRHNPNISAS